MADELYLISGSTLTDIGDAIRGAKGTTAKIQVGNYASEIRNSIPTYHTVTFRDLDYETLATYQVKHGEGVVYTGKTPPISSNGKLFSHWNKDTTNITNNLTVTAVGVAELEARQDFTFEDQSIWSTHISSYSGDSDVVVIPITNRDGVEVGGVTEAAGSLFGNTITSLTIPTGCHYLGSRTFRNCTNLQDVYFLGDRDSWFKNMYWMGMVADSTAEYEGNAPLWTAPRIHTTDGCIINT